MVRFYTSPPRDHIWEQNEGDDATWPMSVSVHRGVILPDSKPFKSYNGFGGSWWLGMLNATINNAMGNSSTIDKATKAIPRRFPTLLYCNVFRAESLVCFTCKYST